MILSTALALISIAYLILINRMRRAWINTPQAGVLKYVPDVSIVVVFRNEAKNLVNLLNDIHQLETDDAEIEIILINDQSEDNGVKLINTWNRGKKLNIRIETLFAVSNAHKKEGIELGLAHASHEYIAVTDADCRLPKTWLKTMVTVNPKRLRCGPVCYQSKNTLASKILELELMGLSAMASSTIAMKKPILANAANMSYSRTLFFEVGGYETKVKNQSPSGDDIDLMRRVFSKHKSAIRYVKHPNALVKTELPQNVREFFNQRLRWAGKTKFSAFKPGSGLTLVLLIFYTMQFMIPIYLMFQFDLILLVVWLTSLALKLAVDYWYFKPILKFYDMRNLLRYLPLTELFHLLYVVPVGIVSIFVPYSWKGRKLKHG